MKKYIYALLYAAVATYFLMIQNHVFAQEFFEATDEDMQVYGRMLGSHSVSDKKSVKISRHENFSVIRVEEEKFCIRSDCLSFVAVKCRRESCPYAMAFAPPKYIVHDEPTGPNLSLGVLSFYDTFEQAIAFGLNADFVAVQPRSRR